jgi:ornithine cyclodeaminase
VPPPVHLTFPEADGDCHVKAGWLTGAEHFTVKVASGFYRNAERGLPVNQGLVCVLSARTGQAVAVLDDRGMLTAWRTAAAGALLGHTMARADATTVGVFGTGEQAFLQVSWLAVLRPVGRVLVSGRTGASAAALCRRLASQGLDAVPAPVDAAAGADIVITATPSGTPVFDAAQVAAGAHVTGIGTDMPHKNELPPALFGRAATIATDDHGQCLHHGDFGWAVRAGVVAEHADIAVGAVLRRPPPRPAAAIHRRRPDRGRRARCGRRLSGHRSVARLTHSGATVDDSFRWLRNFRWLGGRPNRSGVRRRRAELNSVEVGFHHYFLTLTCPWNAAAKIGP